MGSNIKGYGLASKHAIRVMKATKTKGSASEACKYLLKDKREGEKCLQMVCSIAYPLSPFLPPSLLPSFLYAGCSIVNLGSLPFCRPGRHLYLKRNQSRHSCLDEMHCY